MATETDKQNPSVNKSDKEVDVEMETPVDCCTSTAACVKCCCGLNNYWKVLIGTTIMVFYLLLGGLCFYAVEGPAEQDEMNRMKAERIAAATALNEELKLFTEFIVNATNLTEGEALNLTNTLIAVAKRFADAGVNETVADPVWEYASAVFFASTVVTTIGYGTIFPITSGGQIIFIFYSIVGIPLALIVLGTIGSIFSAWLDVALSRLAKNKSPLIIKTTGAIISVLVTLIFFILIPAALFAFIEGPNGWSYLDSVYYCFVTLTTVGFGDFVPGTQGSAISDSRALIGLYRIITSVWVWIGLALVATLISEVQGLFESLGKAMHMYHKRRRGNREFSVSSDDPREELGRAGSPPNYLEKSTAIDQS